ncbi:MAG: O-antigen ligase family protein [Bacteroidota bacterium]|nr:O-antigen ligase family protein [Bacteroidota bacterium]
MTKIFQSEYNLKFQKFTKVILFVILLLLTQLASNQLFEAGYFSYTAIFIIGTLASVILIIKSIRGDGKICFNAIDLSFIAFTLLLFMRWIGTENSWIYSKAAIAVNLIPIYFFIKSFKSIYLIQWALIFTGVFQIVVSFLQKLSYIQNTNSYFEVGGTVGNPNVLAMLLLFTILSAIYLLYQTRATLTRNLLLTYILLALSIIVFTRCRTAILGIVAVGIFFLTKNNWTPIHRTVRLVLIGVLGLTFSGFLLLIIEKSESLTGRLLIWQASFVKIIGKPLWGYGISSFHQVYPDAQRIFLENNLNSNYSYVADTPKWAYNDFIELWLEGGLFTALAFLMILISVLYCWKLQKHFNFNGDNIAFLAATIFFVLSISNFAFTAWPVLLVFVINLAWCSQLCPNNIQIRIVPKLGFALSLALLTGSIVVGTATYKNVLFQYKFNKVGGLPLIEQREFYSNSAKRYQNYTPFAFNHAAFLCSENRTQEALSALHHIYNREPSYQTTYQLAETYRKMNDYKNAEIYYEESLKFLSYRILPRYHLFMIELLNKNYVKADSIRKQALYLNYKGDTILINQIKTSLCKYKINENQINENQINLIK